MKKQMSGIILGILATFMLPQSALIINPALNSLAEIYSDVSYSMVLMLSTVISLSSIPFSLLSGAIVGKKVKYKTITVLSILLASIGGFLPYFLMDNFYAVFACRLVLGVGIGLISPLGNTLVLKLLPKEKQATWQGIGTAVLNIAGILYQSLAGVVCAIDVRYTWLIYGLLLLPMGLTLLFLKEPVQDAPAATETTLKTKLPARVFIITAAFCLLFMLMYPMLLNMSSIVIQENLGSVAVVGTIQSMFSIGGMAAGFLFGKIYKVSGKHVIPIGLSLLVASLMICSFARNVFLLMLSVFLAGLSIHWIMPACLMDFSRSIAPHHIPLASSLFVAGLNAGGFLSAPFIGLVASVSGNASPRLPILTGLIGTGLIALLWTISLTRSSHNCPAFIEQ